MKSLRAIADEINAAAVDYRMHDFHEIRQGIHGLKRRKIGKIFTAQTTFDDYAFHYGGRKEIQFNIGFEGNHKEWLRYGIAFSLEPNQTLPDPLILKPRVHRLSEYIEENQSGLGDIRFWYYLGKGPRSTEQMPAPIPQELIRVGNFLFWGKRSPRDKVQPGDVLAFFDRLLPIYELVESSIPLKKRRAELDRGIQFRPGCPQKTEAMFRQSQAITKEVILRHNKLQETLYLILSKKYGKDNVGTENDTGRGSRVDVVVRDGDRHTYYEIKTSLSIRDCLRDGIAQLIEYSYWPGGIEAKALVVVSENPLTPDARRYLSMLRDRFKLPIFYQCLDLTRGSLGDRE